MLGANLNIKKGKIFVYRVYDIAHEIDLKRAQTGLERMSGADSVRRYQLKKDPLRKIIMREAPLILSGGEEELNINVNGQIRSFKSTIEVKIWDYGVLSFSYRIDLTDVRWKELVILGSILDSDSVIDEVSKRKKDEIAKQINDSLRNPYSHSVFEDYTTYVIEEIEDKTQDDSSEKLQNPLNLIKVASIPELLLAEPSKTLAETTKRSVSSNISQYTKKDALILDWNSSLVIDFTKEKEYQEYVDIIEFSITQLLELRIYDQLLDERLDLLYQSIENDQHGKITDFYSQLSTEAGQLYLEFSDFFEKIDGSIKTVGDFYSAKVLKTANKRLGFDELKQTMSRKIDILSKISKMLQSKVDSLVDERRNQIGEEHIKKSHRMEFAILVLIVIEVIPTLKEFFHYVGTIIR
jgi:heat shock protein HspQ